MKLKHAIFILFTASILLNACAPTRLVKPLEKGQKDVSFSLGGPLIGYAGTTIPIPLSSVCGAYGIKENLTAFASFHTTALAYGTFQTDMGIVKQISKQNKYIPAISITPVVNLMFDKWENNFSFYPEFDWNLYWNYNQKKNFFYVGNSNWFEARLKRAHEETQEKHLFPSIYLGHTFVRNKMTYTIESKFINPNVSNENMPVDYKSLGKKGAIGIYFTISKRF